MIIKNIQISEAARLTAYIPDSEVGYHLYRKRPAIILAPGGAYLMHVTREKEGVALEFLAKGYNVFLLEYSLGFSSREVKESKPEKLDTDHRFPLPLYDMFEAIHIVRTHSEEFNTDKESLFLMGFSAGGHLCGAAGVFWNRPEYTDKLSFVSKGNELRATGMILCYPMLNAYSKSRFEISDPDSHETILVREFMYQSDNPTKAQIDALDLTKQINEDTIPTFIWHSTDDPVVDSENSTRFILELQKRGIKCSYHLFDYGGHGLGLANKVYAHDEKEIIPEIAEWTTLADNWMNRISG